MMKVNSLLVVSGFLPPCLATKVAPAFIDTAGPLVVPQACAFNCFSNVASTCNSSLFSMSCLCGVDIKEMDNFKCLMANCPTKDAIVLQNITTTACSRPVRDHSTKYTALSTSFSLLANILIISRLAFNRFFGVRAFTLDDWVVLALLPIKIAGSIVNRLGIYQHGLGKDIWTMTPDEVSKFAFYVYLGVIFYVVDMTFLKVIFSLFYLSLFSGSVIRHLLWATAAFHVLSGLAFIMAGTFSCTPIEYYWTQYSTTTQGHCLHKLALYWANGATTVASDIWLLAIPMSQLYKLRLHWKKKVAAAIMFLAGFIGTIISIIRFRAVLIYAKSINPTFDQAKQGLLAELEINVGFICACLPTVRLILARLFPTVFGSGETKSRRCAVTAQTNTLFMNKPAEYVEMGDVSSQNISGTS